MATIKRGLYLTEEAQEPLHAQEEGSTRPAAQQPLVAQRGVRRPAMV
jgi:hypothetical protein